MSVLEDIEARVLIDELRDAQAAVGDELARAVIAMSERHAIPEPVVKTLAAAYLELGSRRKLAQRARMVEVAG